MKRPAAADDRTEDDAAKKRAKMKEKVADAGGGGEEEGCVFQLDDDLLFEVLRHVDDSRTLEAAACVSRQWHRTAQDERLWELFCNRHWRLPVGCTSQQMRSVVLALGGFRRLHAHCLLPLIKPPTLPVASASASASGSGSSTPPQPLSAAFPSSISAKPQANWGKDEVHVSLSLLSIRHYEKMNINKLGR